VLPRDHDFVRAVAEKLESVTVVLLLPVFFAFVGLRTSLRLMSGNALWWYCLLVVVVAIVGKLAGSALAARAAGIPWRNAAAIGVLMNTRGLMQLVILNLGFELGVINQALFSMLVVMALVTTFLTTPLLEWINPVRERRAESTVARV
jgi:Kef-type K+ transport system membrane component KefB